MARSTNTQFAVAVHVLTYLAGDVAAAVSSEELSRSTNVNPVYVRRVLGPLREAGLVRSRPGVHGGWELTPDGRDVTLARIWRLVQGDDAVLGLHGPDPGLRGRPQRSEVPGGARSRCGRRTVRRTGELHR